MTLLALILAAGCIAGWLSGGRFRRLSGLRLRHLPVLAAALAAQLCLGWLTAHVAVAVPVRAAVAVASDVLVGMVLVANLAGRQPAVRGGLEIVTAGWFLNALPMVACGAMPVSRGALGLAGLSGGVARGHLGKHVLAVRAGAVPSGWLLLGDWIPSRALQVVASPGDVLMALGLVLTVAAGMHARPAPASEKTPSETTPRPQTPSAERAARSKSR